MTGVRSAVDRRVLALAAVVLAIGSANFGLREAGFATSLRYGRMMVLDQATADSWRPMLRALGAWDTGQPIYETVFFAERVKFQYPLTSLLLPLAVRSEARSGVPLMKALNHVALPIFALLVACTAAIFLLTWFDARPDWRRWPVWVGLAAVISGSLLFFPALMAYVLGQIQTFVNTAVAVMIVAWLTGRRAAAGAALGLACLVKPHVALFLLWGVLRRQWAFTGTAATVVLAGAALSVAIFGWRDNVDYLRVVQYMAERGEALYANQSVNGVLNRLLQAPEHLGWDSHAFPPPHPLVRLGTVAAGVLLVGAALAAPLLLGFAGTTLDIAVMALSVTIASPIAWDHHYGVLLPMLALAGGLALRQPPPARGRLMAALLVVLVLVGSLWEPLVLIDEPPWNLVQSYVLAGALLMLAVLYRLGALMAAHGVRPDWKV